MLKKEIAQMRGAVEGMAGALAERATLIDFGIARSWAVDLGEYAHMKGKILEDVFTTRLRVLAGSTVTVHGDRSITPGFGYHDARISLTEPQEPNHRLVRPTVVSVTDGSVAISQQRSLPRLLAAQRSVNMGPYKGSVSRLRGKVIVEPGGDIFVGPQGAHDYARIPLDEYSGDMQGAVLLTAGHDLARAEFALDQVSKGSEGIEKSLFNSK